MDEYTKYSVVKFMKLKSEALEMNKEYVAEKGTPGKFRTS